MKARWVRALLVVLAVSLFIPLQSAQAAKKKKAKEKESPPAAEVQKKAPKETKAKKETAPPAAAAESKPAKKAKSPEPQKAEAPKPAPKVDKTATAFPPAELTVGFQARDSETEGLGDLLIPIWNPGGKGLLFVNPRSAFTDHDGEEANLGLGYRQLLPKQKVILGGNAFYDYRDTGTTHYDQWGLGVELLSTWLDARANYYDPEDDETLVASETETSTRQSASSSAGWNDPYAEDHYVLQDYVVTRTVTTTTSTKTFEQFEQALGGYDWEIGLRLPLPVKAETLEARIFGGYYDFDNDLGSEVNGWKARAELRLLSSLFLDAGLYEDDQLTGSDWYAGARLSVPLDLAAVAKGRNPFATAKSRLDGAPRDLSARLTEMVMRDPQIRLDVSKFIENPDLATELVSKKKDKDATTYLLLPDVQFVDSDAGVSGDGSAEHPFRTIQQGANAVFGSRNVYVYAASGPYNENVVLQPDTTLWGSGVPIPGFNNKFFGSGIQPVVDGLSMGPSITMANNTTVKGFYVRNTDTGGPEQLVLVPGFPTWDISRAGIYGNNVTDLAITQNTLAGNELGAVLYHQGDFSLLFDENAVFNNVDGLDIYARGSSGTFNAEITRSSFVNNTGQGALIMADNYDESYLFVNNSDFSRNGLVGLNVIQSDSILAMAMLEDLSLDDNLGVGLVLNQVDNIFGLANISDTSASRNAGPGIVLTQVSDLISVGLVGLPEGVGRSTDNLAWLAGIPLPDQVSMLLGPDGPVTASDNGGPGIVATSVSTELLSLGGLFDITANNNSGDGVVATIVSTDGIGIGLGGSSENWNEIAQLGNQVGDLFDLDLGLDIDGSGHFQANGNIGGNGLVFNTFGGIAAINAIVGVETVDNDLWGSVISSTSSELALNAAARINASDNGQGGLQFDATGDNLGAFGLLADVTATGNEGGDGILASCASANGGAALLALSTDALRPAAAVLGEEFLGAPFDLPFDSFGPIVASGNAGNGFQAIVNGNDFAAAAIFDTQANGNTLDGINLSVNSANGLSLAAILSSDLLYDVIPGIFGADPVPSAGLGPVLANGNGGNGIVITQTGLTGAYGLLAGVEANNNTGGDGFNLSLTSATGDVFAAMIETDAANNSDEGIELAMNSYGSTLSALAYVDVTSNANQGVRVFQTSTAGASLALLGGVDAMYNGGAGINYNLTATSGVAAACITESESMFNGGRGASITLTAGSDAALMLGTNALNQLLASGYVGGLPGVVLGAVGDLIPQDEPDFSNNEAAGLYAELNSTGGDVYLDIDGAFANRNTNSGFNIALTAPAGDIFGNIGHAEAVGNGGTGINLVLNGAGGTLGLGLSDIRTTDNSANGINVDETYNGIVTLRGERIVSTNNTANGVRLAMSGLTVPVMDFGGGIFGSTGQSSIYGNGNRDFRYNNGGGATVMAENNWWGIAPPVAGQFAGSIDRNPWLLAPPP